MKLLSCHIENFGIFSDFDFTFEEGLTVLYEENGYGKSTLAAFLKAMLYGFPRTGARNITENERKRYDPWQGGKYGGYLEFETAGITYRVTRYFGKTAAKDSFALYDLTNRQGSALFPKSWERSSFSWMRPPLPGAPIWLSPFWERRRRRPRSARSSVTWWMIPMI